jgi:hypothetical protein
LLKYLSLKSVRQVWSLGIFSEIIYNAIPRSESEVYVKRGKEIADRGVDGIDGTSPGRK